MDSLLTVEEAAERLGTSVRFVRRLIFERRIAYTNARPPRAHRGQRPGRFITAGRVEAGTAYQQGA